MIGRKLKNRYTIREHLGDGSTATVYKAYDEKLGRDVAIKMLLPHVRDTTRVRFTQEANAAAKLNHPNIMLLYDIEDEDNRLFLILEYVEGAPLSKYVPSAPDLVIKLGTQIARALQYAHDNGIIHRDIKPANIKVTSDGKVKLMDLGLALTKESQRVTAQGMVIGTPAYLSPEQAQGHPLDARTDIYSLGIVLYEMLTGQLPFNADDIGALLLQQVKQPPPPPRLLVPSLSVELERVILRTLEKQAARRFQTCESLAQALDSCMPEDPDDRATNPMRPAWADTLQAPSTETRRSPRRTIRIVLADDHTLLRKTLMNSLEQRDEFVVVAEAGDGESALQQTLASQPDLLILDLNMPVKNGLEVLPEIRQQAPRTKILILSGRQEEAYIVQALRAGAHGYILKSAEEEELFEAILKVMDGQLYLGRGVAEKVVTGMLSSPDDTKLTDVETAIMRYVANGYENDAIARRMGITMMTVIESLARAMNKLKAKDRHAAALKAIRLGYLTMDDIHNLPDPE